MNKRQRRIEAKNYIVRFVEAGQHEGIIDEYGEEEGSKILAEVKAIIALMKPKSANS